MKSEPLGLRVQQEPFPLPNQRSAGSIKPWPGFFP